ncbi:MAG: hypothetical protein JWM46_229 [Candidatus Kaiserbacteria bacterium]|nr:hypothetical protein [Candidatus Kaiserbacteria bacterium]
MIRRYLPKSTEELIHWYERYISPLSLIAGFFADNLVLLRRVDLLRSNLLLIFYLVLSMTGIILINLIEAGKWKRRWVLAVAPFIPIVIQFAFGGLFSGFLSLYSRSASFALSWIFVVVLAFLLLGNERFRKLYVRLSFQMPLYFTVLFAFFAFFLPVIFRAIGPWMFVVSGISALLVITALFFCIEYLVPELARPQRLRIMRAIAIIYVVFNILYFSNAIPPLPLALKESGVYHKVTRIGTEYQLAAEQQAWYQPFLFRSIEFHYTKGESAWIYSAVFAPTGLSTALIHEWQRYDIASKNWITTDTLRFQINGGRDGGYRGYSIKSGITPGKWRVNVKTQYGQIIGRITFVAVEVPAAEPTVTITH